MKGEAEIRGRILALERIREGVMGRLTRDQKRTINLMIEELLWVLDDECKIASRKDTKAEGVLDKAGITTKEIDKINEESKRGSDVRILAVDDEPIILELIAEILTDQGYKVATIDNPIDALEQIKTKRYALLLLDIHMLGMGGFGLYEHIQKINQSLASKVVFMTGKSNFKKKYVRDFLSKTKAPCITKPFDPQQFKGEIKCILSRGT